MSDIVNIGKTSVMGISIFLVIYFLGLQLTGLSLEMNISKAYIDFYSGLIPLGILSIIGIVVFRIRYFDAFGDYLSGPVKFFLIIGWTLFIVILSFRGTQVIPVPRASAEGLQLTEGTELYLSTIVPGILEDLVYLAGLPMVLMTGILLFLEFGLSIEPSAGLILGIAIMSAFVASLGYNIWVIPGFASAHVPSYGASSPALAGAFMFSFGQSLVYIFSGLFIPAAHILHNAIVFMGAATGLSIGPLSISGGS